MIKNFWLRVKSFLWNLYGTLLLKTKFKLDDSTVESILMHMDMRYGTNYTVMYTTGTFEPRPVTKTVINPADHKDQIFTIPVQVRHRKPLSVALYSQIRDYVAKGLYTPGVAPIRENDLTKVTLEVLPSSEEFSTRKRELEKHTSKSKLNLFTQRVFSSKHTIKQLELTQNGYLYPDIVKQLDQIEE